MTLEAKQFGDPTGGFSVATSTATGEVQVTAWGFWSVEVATSFEGATRNACSQPGAKKLVLDMRSLKPMRDEGQKGVGALMQALPRLGIGTVTVVTSSQLTKLQLLRLARETGMKDRIEFVDRAEDISNGS